jgi:hypothetical protein
MKQIQPTPNEHHWPRQTVASLECRKRDLVIRIADWSRQSPRTGEPAFDVEVYIGGVYDWNESKTCSLYEYATKAKAKAAAVTFAQTQIAKLL